MLENISLKFKHMSLNTTKIMFAMLKNQNLLRYIHYLSDTNPLDTNFDNVSLATVKKDNFVLSPFDPKFLLESKVRLFLNPYSGRFLKKSDSQDIYALDIVVPYDYWIIGKTSELRVYSIAYEIAKTIDQKNIAGVGNIIITDYKAYKVDDTFAGITLFFEVSNATYMG